MDRQELEFKKLQTKELEENIRDTMRIPLDVKGSGEDRSGKRSDLGDRDLLLSLLYNLLDNAVKAVEEGGFILMKGSRRTQGYEIKVVDNGRGSLRKRSQGSRRLFIWWISPDPARRAEPVSEWLSVRRSLPCIRGN